MKIFTRLFKFLPILFAFCGLFCINENAWGYAASKLTVKVSGQGQVAVTTSSTQPGSSSYSSTSASDEQSDLGVLSTHTYYVWVKPNEGYRCTGVSDCSWNNAGYYTISITGRTSRVKKEVTATFVGNSYTISFAGNSNTSGTMSDQSGFVYGTAKTLSTNTFGRAYTVNYDANGGSCGTSSATATYTFNGWKSSNGTSYADKASVSTFSPTPAHGATVTLTAQWTSASVTLPNATKDGAVLDGWYSGNTKIGDPGDAYTPTANITLTANWINKYDFEITGDDYTINNEAWNKTSAFNFVHADEANMTTTIEKTDVISYDRAKNTITALKIGTSKITFTQNTSSTVKNGSFVFTITVDSVANTLAVSNTSFTCYVDTANFANIISNKNSDATVTTTSTDASIAYYKVSEDKIYVPNNEAKSFSETTVTLHIKQAGTGKYKAVDKTITLTVKKRPNPLTCSWGAKPWSKNVNFDSHTAVTFTTANTEAGAPAVTVSKVSGGAVADYNSSTKKIDANHRVGTVIWEVEQVENYKYVRAFEKCTVNVGTVSAPDCDVLLYSSDPDNEASEVGEIDLGGVGTRVDFQMKKKGAGATATLSFYVPGSGWSSKSVSASSIINYDNHSEDLPTGTTKIKFAKGGLLGTDDPYINTIRVMRTKYFDIENKAGSAITEMTMPLNIHGGVVKRDTFYVDYSTCEGTIKLENHHPRIKFAATNSNSFSFSTGTAHHGRPSIALTYTSPANDAENITDTIYIYTPSDHKKLIVHAQSKGRLQTTLHYIGKASYSADTTNIASIALFEVRDENNDLVANPVITLGTGTTSSVTLANDNKSIASLCGNSNDGTTGNVTASYAGDGTYEAATNNGLSQNFTINRLKDEVSFDSGYESMIVGEEIDLTEWVTSCTSGSDITITSVFTDYIVIEDGKVKALAKGNGRLRAVSEGNCTYNSGTSYLNIKVRNADDPCESPLLYKSGLLKVGAYGANNGTTLTIKDGPQDKLTFKVWRVTAATQYARLIFLDKDNNEITHIDYDAGSLPTSEPESYNKTINLTLPAYAGTKKIQVDGWGTLNKYFKELRVSQQTYLTASASSVTMSTVKGCETAVGQVNISYSDVSRLQFSQTNENFRYEVWEGETKLEDGFANDCGDYGTYTVKFFYEPQTVGEYSNTVTISASGLSQTITLNGTANKPDRSIVWDIPSGNVISATQSVDLTAYAETSCLSPAGGVYYTAVPSDAVTIDGDLITFNRAATVTVTAHTVPSDDYNDALTVDKVWTVGKVGVVMQTLPTITSTITCGNTSSVVTWANDWTAVSSLNDKDTIPGSIAYVGPAIFTTAGETNLTFNFTPNNLNVYDATPFTVPVTVQHITSVATPSAANIVYGNPISSSTLSNTGTPGTWSWNTADNSAVLAVGTHTGLAVHFTPDDSNYSELDATVTLIVDPVPADEFTNAEGDNDWDNPNNWASGEVPTDETPDIIVSGELVIDEEVTVGSLTIQSTGGVNVVTDGILTVTGVSEDIASYGDLHVKNDGEVILANTADLKVNNFILDAKLGDADKQAASGQIFGIDHMTIDNKVYFDITFDPRGYITFGWYDFAVPFEVNINGGISRINSTSDKVMVSGKDFILKEADEAARANGGYIWRKVTSSVLTPGKLYTITLDDEVNQNTLRFTWNGHNGLSNGTSFDPQFTASGSDTEMRGWNGVGNGMLSHGYPAVSYKRQAYNHDDNKYELVTGDKTFAVGSAFVIQVPDENSFDWTPAQSSLTRPLFAPQYETYEVDEFLLNLRQTETNKVADKLYFSASDDATDAYVIGRDLLKMGNPLEAKSAQMWATKGGRVLCDVEATLYNDNASTPITFFAPQAGTYTLSVDEMPENASLYLTYEGKAIWLLSAGAYTLDLEKGTTEGFGLRLVTNASQVTTGVDAIESEDGTNRKVIINNTMYIITKDGAIYDVLGKSVKN